MEMKFWSAVSGDGDAGRAAGEVGRRIEEGMEGQGIDVLFAFLTAGHREKAQGMLDDLAGRLSPGVIIGCCAEGVIGEDREIERSAGVSLLAASWPGVRVEAFHIAREDWPGVLEGGEALREVTGVDEETRAIVGMADPFTTPVRQMLSALDSALPGIPLIGGLASAARQPGENVLLMNDRVVNEGFVGVSIGGPVVVDTLVSQGCRPVGQRMIITKGKDNVIEQLGGHPAMASLSEVIDSLPVEERDLLHNGLFIGRAVSEYRESFGRGDFLVRNVIGVDRQSGAIAVNDLIRVGQTVQFHVRDVATASEDLAEMLGEAGRKGRPAGALLFSCNGRGQRMFSTPCHDVSAAREAFGGVAVAGFFAAGEFGPVGASNFIHGHTASLALFRPI